MSDVLFSGPNSEDLWRDINRVLDGRRMKHRKIRRVVWEAGAVGGLGMPDEEGESK